MGEFEAGGMLLGIGAIVASVGEAYEGVEPATILADHFEQMGKVQDVCADIVSRWFDKETDSSKVTGETAPILEQLEPLLLEIEALITEAFGGTPGELTQTRLDAQTDLIEELFSSSE